jgi:hypothetical protein
MAETSRRREHLTTGKEKDYSRIWGRISNEKGKQLQQWADELGIPMMQFIGLCAWMGAHHLMRSFHPERFITGDQWAEIVMGLKEKGFEINVSDDMSKLVVKE